MEVDWTIEGYPANPDYTTAVENAAHLRVTTRLNYCSLLCLQFSGVFIKISVVNIHMHMIPVITTDHRSVSLAMFQDHC